MLGLSGRIFAIAVLALVFTAASSFVLEQPLYAQTTPAPDQPQSFNALLTTADVSAGEAVSHKCSMCHTFGKGESNRIGPNLWNIVGNLRARLDSFNYSDELKSMHNEKWTYDALNLYLANPHKFAPGGRMTFAGIKDIKERANLIAWLRTLSDNPVPLPVVK